MQNRNLVFVESIALGAQAVEYAKGLGHTVTFVNSPRYEFLMSASLRDKVREMSDHWVTVDDIHNVEDVIAGLQAAGVSLGPDDAVLTTLQMGAQPAAVLAETLGARGASASAVAAARDKARCREILKEAGIASLGSEAVTSLPEALAAAERIGYPVILKPAYGVGKLVTSIVRSQAEMESFFSQLEDEFDNLRSAFVVEFDRRFLVEELAVGPLYSAEVATDGQHFVSLAVVRRRVGLRNPVIELGCTVPSGLTPDEERELGDYAIQVCQALGLNLGLFHVEIMHTPAGFRLIEVNPRITGGVLPESLNLVSDGNVFKILVDLYLGEPAPREPLRLHAASTHRFFGAAENSVIDPDLPADWFEPFLRRAHSGYMNAKPGAQVKEMTGNLGSFAMLRVVADTVEQAETECDEILTEIEKALGFRLITAAPSPWQEK